MMMKLGDLIAVNGNLISCGNKGYYMQIISVTEEGI